MTEKEFPEKRFLVDSMLGKVAKWLRILGFDARLERLSLQEELDDCRKEGFTIITRNRRWCGQARVLCLTANDPMEQLREVITQVRITSCEVRPLHRCILCNQPLERITREQAFENIPDYVYETNTLFYRCPDCRRVYWPGSHPKRMMERLQRVLGWSV